MKEASMRRILELERQATRSRVQLLNTELNAIIADEVDATPADRQEPIMQYERERVAALLEDAQHYLSEIDDALGRLTDGTYGECEKCRKAIPDERIIAFPTSRTCVECAAVRR